MRISSSMANHDYERNEIDDAFLLHAELVIEYFPVLDDFPFPNYLFSSIVALAIAPRPHPPLKRDWLLH